MIAVLFDFVWNLFAIFGCCVCICLCVLVAAWAISISLSAHAASTDKPDVSGGAE